MYKYSLLSIIRFNSIKFKYINITMVKSIIKSASRICNHE